MLSEFLSLYVFGLSCEIFSYQGSQTSNNLFPSHLFEIRFPMTTFLKAPAPMPLPCVPDDHIYPHILRFPAEDTFCLLTAANEVRRVAGSSVGESDFKVFPSHTLYRVNDFQHTRTFLISQVEAVTFATVFQILQRLQMRLRQVCHMDIIPHTAPIRRRIVCSKHLDVRSLP